MADYLLVGLVSVITLGVAAQWLAWRLKLPAILLLLIFGIVAGPVMGMLTPQFYLDPDQLFGDLLSPIVSISVAIILFEGGLSLRLSELREIGDVVGKMISIGVIVTWSLSTVFSYLFLDFGWQLSLLFGAILIVTGPTVIIPLLRQVRPAGNVGSVLKWEGIVNDPIGAMMAVLVFEILLAGGLTSTHGSPLMSIVNTVVFGTFFGLLGAVIIYYMLKRHMVPDFLQNPVSLMVVMVVFAASNLMQHESGLMAVTIMGIALANQKTVRVKHIIEFKENLRVLLISALFIMLASRLKLEHLQHLSFKTVAFLGALILLVRPAAVFLSSIGSRLNIKERLFLSWMAPRGIVAAAISAIFALRLSESGYENAELLVPYTFIVIIGTVALYGLSANWVACRLKVAKPVPRGLLFLGAHDWSRKMADILHQEGFKVLLADSNWENIASARKADLDTYYGNILAEYAMDEIDLDGVGRLLALTPNDEVNSLAILRFEEIFGTSEVFQLPPVATYHRKEREVPDYLSGRILFGEEMNFSHINQLFEEGAYIKKTEITDQHSFKNFKQEVSDRAIPLFLINNNNEVRIFSVDNPPAPVNREKVICLMIPEEIDSEVGEQATITQTT